MEQTTLINQENEEITKFERQIDSYKVSGK